MIITMKQNLLFPDSPYEKDIVFTQSNTAADIIEWVSPYGKCLDPCKGDGAFLDHLPVGSDWCEVREGKDFFDYHETVEWIIGNKSIANPCVSRGNGKDK